MEELERQSREAKEDHSKLDVPKPSSVTYVDYDDPWSLINDASGHPHISKLSQNAWVACGGDNYVLECLGKGYIKISPSVQTNGDSHFVAHYTPAIMKWSTAKAFGLPTRFRSKRDILIADTLDRALQGCDTYARTKVLFGPMQMGYVRFMRTTLISIYRAP